MGEARRPGYGGGIGQPSVMHPGSSGQQGGRHVRQGYAPQVEQQTRPSRQVELSAPPLQSSCGPRSTQASSHTQPRSASKFLSSPQSHPGMTQGSTRFGTPQT
jgi:hypothetical protein